MIYDILCVRFLLHSDTLKKVYARREVILYKVTIDENVIEIFRSG